MKPELTVYWEPLRKGWLTIKAFVDGRLVTVQSKVA